jgi:crotonobetainyl-CoA:carnitine CoA-transferase CaiB-like acyl-CoA transferase
MGNEHPSLAPYEPYPAADGWIVVAVANPRLWSRFCGAIGADALEHDPRFASNSERLQNRDALNAVIGELFRTKSVEALLERLTAAGVPCGRVRSIDEVVADPQLLARDMLVDVAAGQSSIKVPGNPVKLSDTPGDPRRSPPPALGEHTEEIRRRFGRHEGDT